MCCAAFGSELSGDRGWVTVFSSETGVVADRLVAGFNDKLGEKSFEDEPAPNQMMLVSDMVRMCPGWAPIEAARLGAVLPLRAVAPR